MLGSMADVPKDLLDQIKRLEELFTVPKEKLKEITDHFISELAKGTRIIQYICFNLSVLTCSQVLRLRVGLL